MTARTLVIHPVLAKQAKAERSTHAALEEAVGLAAAIALEVVHASVVRLQRVTPASYIGKGKIEELAALVQEQEIILAVMDCALTPVQQRNLEKGLGCKVIDRTALILEIFGARARTAEGKLQVELASLSYQKSRLVRSWTHLERQRGGFGFLGGPGESQIELDRRMIGDRIIKIKNQLANVVRTRELHRENRREVPYPLVALVGYTNAGKSTLFNRLTDSGVVAQDMLFATLDPTIRACTLPGGMKIMLSDTVGFISNLPTELIAAFRATLEEVLSADVLLHVRDISHEDSDAQKKDVLGVLKELFNPRGSSRASPEPARVAPQDAPLASNVIEHLIEVQNKIDLLPEGVSPYPAQDMAIGVSAVTGEGIHDLLQIVENALTEQLLQERDYTIAHGDGKAIAWLYAHAQVRARRDLEEQAVFTVLISPMNAARFARQFG